MFAVEFLHFFPLEASTLALDLISTENAYGCQGDHTLPRHMHTPQRQDKKWESGPAGSPLKLYFAFSVA